MESHLVSKDSAKRKVPTQCTSNYRLDLAYIGGSFLGWQSQLHGNTVQDVVENGLKVILREKVRILGASRTDTGVHAEHQVACFRSREGLDCGRIRRSLEAVLPESIGVYSLKEVATTFHPIQDARSKLYRYRIWQGKGMSPYARPFVWNFPKALDFARMEEAAKLLIGRHNFKSFCASDSSSKTFERTIFDIQWLQEGPLIEFYVLGEGFLKQMIRSLIGTLVEVGCGKRTLASFESALKSLDRTAAGQTAPASGLSLVRIFYEPKETISSDLLGRSGLLCFQVQTSEIFS